MERPFQLRPAKDTDRNFLYDVYASTREPELAMLDWDHDAKKHFLEMQFNAQHSFYHEQFPDAEYSVIVRDDAPIGRLYVDRRPDEIRIIDIALLPQHRNGGLGTTMMKDIMDEAARGGRPVRIHVEKYNPALNLYRRLGFTEIGDAGVYLLMEYKPGSATGKENGS